jgi:hypothetical protein
MAITWDGGSGFFDKLGKLVAIADHITNQRKDIASPNEAIEHQFTQLEGKLASIDRKSVTSVEVNRNALESSMDGILARLVNEVTLELLVNEIAENENVETRSLLALWHEASRFMVRDSKTVEEVTWTATGAATPDAGNTFGGVSLASVLKESIPGNPQDQERPEALLDYEQRGVPQTWRIVCSSDADSGSAEGAEVFLIQGEGPQPAKTDLLWERRSNLGSMQLISSVGNTVVVNGGFETWGTSVPASWLASPTTSILEDTVISHRGEKSLRITENASISQDLPSSFAVLVPLKKYLISFMVRRRGTFATGSLRLTLNVGTVQANSVVVDLSSDLPNEDTWVRFSAFVNTQRAFTDTPKVTIQMTNVVASGIDSWINVDEVTVSRVTRFENVYLAILAGTTLQRPVVGDGFTIAIAQTATAKFQRFVYRFFGVILPSSGSPSIADSLADVT